MEKGDIEKLVQKLEKAIMLQPDFVPLMRLAGDYYEIIGEKDKAIQVFAHILELYPGEPAWMKYETRIAEDQENKKQNE